MADATDHRYTLSYTLEETVNPSTPADARLSVVVHAPNMKGCSVLWELVAPGTCYASMCAMTQQA